MTEASTDPQPDAAGAERPRRRLNIGIRRKPREEPGEDATAAGAAPAPAVDEHAPPGDGEAERPRRGIGIRRKQRPAEVEVDPGGRGATIGRLRRERRALMDVRQQEVYDLGGLAFELHRRDLLRVEVLRGKAALIADLDGRVRDVDAQIDELEDRRRSRGRRGEEQDAGACIKCQAPFREDAAYCWRCGARLTVPSTAEQDTGTIPRVAEAP